MKHPGGRFGVYFEMYEKCELFAMDHILSTYCLHFQWWLLYQVASYLHKVLYFVVLFDTPKSPTLAVTHTAGSCQLNYLFSLQVIVCVNVAELLPPHACPEGF